MVILGSTPSQLTQNGHMGTPCVHRTGNFFVGCSEWEDIVLLKVKMSAYVVTFTFKILSKDAFMHTLIVFYSIVKTKLL